MSVGGAENLEQFFGDTSRFKKSPKGDLATNVRVQLIMNLDGDRFEYIFMPVSNHVCFVNMLLFGEYLVNYFPPY